MVQMQLNIIFSLLQLWEKWGGWENICMFVQLQRFCQVLGLSWNDHIHLLKAIKTVDWLKWVINNWSFIIAIKCWSFTSICSIHIADFPAKFEKLSLSKNKRLTTLGHLLPTGDRFKRNIFLNIGLAKTRINDSLARSTST